MPHILGFAIIAVAVALVAIRSAICHFECPDCGEHFHVSFFKYLFTLHQFGKRYVTCPKCGNSGYLTPMKGKE